MIRSSLALVTLLALSCLLSVLAPVRSAEEKAGWTDLTDLSVWKGPVKGWVVASDVTMDDKDKRKLTFTEKKDGDKQIVLVNGKAGRAQDLVSKESFGDVELHAEFFIP